MQSIIPLGFYLLVFASIAQADFTLDFIQLHHRQSQAIIPLVKPFLHPSASISGKGYQLVIRTTEDNLKDIQKIVKKFDTRLRQLSVWVTQDSHIVAQEQRIEASARIKIGPAKIILNHGRDPFNVKIRRTDVKSDDLTDQQITVLEGHSAWIQVGKAIPIPHNIQNYYGETVAGVHYEPVLTGFYLTPRMVGDEVILDISPNKASVDRLGHGINIQQSHSVVRTRLGRWVMLGGDLREKHQNHQGLLRYQTEREQSEQTIYIKVDEIP